MARVAARVLALSLAGIPVFSGVLLLFLVASLVISGLGWLFAAQPVWTSMWRLVAPCLVGAGALTLIALVAAGLDDRG